MNHKRLLLLEFNELCPPLLDRWMREGRLPNFSRFAMASDMFVTQADEPEGDTLNPWIQWYSLHTGLPYSSHGVFRLTDGLRCEHQDIWSVLSNAGFTTANMSSMNARWGSERRGFYVPDPWCGEEATHPRELSAYHRFVSQQVQGHSAGAGLRLGDAVRFVAFMARHGLSADTLVSVIRQLADETVTGGRAGWRRASLLDRFQRDVFLRYLRKFQPDFATFFINSTAHYQHCYWRNFEPEKFKIQPTSTEQETFKDAILYGYQMMDRLLGDFFRLEDDGYTLALATALSQQPYLAAEERGGQLYYRPLDFTAFLHRHDVHFELLEPVMAQQFVLRFRDRRATEEAARKLRGFVCDGAQVFEVADEGACALNVANWLHHAVPHDSILTHSELGIREPFYDVFYQMEAMKSGRHHRDGVLWIKRGRQIVHTEKASILSVFPTVLDMFGVDVPADHAGPRDSLLTSAA